MINLRSRNHFESTQVPYQEGLYRYHCRPGKWRRSIYNMDYGFAQISRRSMVRSPIRDSDETYVLSRSSSLKAKVLVYDHLNGPARYCNSRVPTPTKYWWVCRSHSWGWQTVGGVPPRQRCDGRQKKVHLSATILRFESLLGATLVVGGPFFSFAIVPHD